MTSQVASFGCASKEQGEEIFSAEFNIYSPDGSVKRKALLMPESFVSLVEGEYADIGTIRYQAKSPVGDWRIVDGRIKARNMKITDLLRPK